jgi:hypothetical protein
MINSIQSWIANRKITMLTKVILYLLIFAGNMYYGVNNWKNDRPQTLYDIYNVSRLATFEELKVAKDFYLEKLKEKEDPENENVLELVDYKMTKEEV